MKKHIAKLLLVLLLMTFVFTALPPTASAVSDISYKITTKICNGFQNGTNSNKVNFTFYGTNGTHKIENIGRKIKGDAFERNKTDTYEFSCTDLGEIYGLNVSCGTDAVKFEYIKIEKISGSTVEMAHFSIGDWIDNTNRTYYANLDRIYRVKVLVGDHPLDGTVNDVSMVVADTSGKTFTVNITNALPEKKLLSGMEYSFCVRSSAALGTLSNITLQKPGGSDDWHPLYVQLEKMSASTSKDSVKWENEVLFVCDQTIGNQDVKVAKYTGNFKAHSASGLASIFFEPNFYVIAGIILLLAGAGVWTYRKKKKAAIQ